jgi:hypothetical protein
MSDDNPLSRALKIQEERRHVATKARPDAAKLDEIMARRGRQASSPPPVRTATPPAAAPVTGPERVLIPLVCSAIGQAGTELAERITVPGRGEVLRLVGHAAAASGPAQPVEQSALLSGSYSIEQAPGWACPFCGNNSGWWQCGCGKFPGTLHCMGSERDGTRRHCACGKFEQRQLNDATATVSVRGQSIATATRASAQSAASGALIPAAPRMPTRR